MEQKKERKYKRILRIMPLLLILILGIIIVLPFYSTSTCSDSDGDGFYNLDSCSGFLDCDDSDANINIMAVEICDDGIDNNCNGNTDCDDYYCMYKAVCDGSCPSQLPAFPGAEGFGAEATGGRGGTVITVTNLDNSGAGSLRAALEASGSRIIVFNISGTIILDTAIRPSSNFTLAGQTAPDDGITLTNCGIKMRGDDWSNTKSNAIIRDIRVRGTETCEGGDEDDGMTFYYAENYILDHVSISWACDEQLGFGDTRNATVQWSMINEGSLYLPGTTTVCPGHTNNSYGVLHKNGESERLTIHHTLIAKMTRRYPLIGAEHDELRNNVFYGWRDVATYFNWCYPSEGSIFSEPFTVNIAGNYYKTGIEYDGTEAIEGCDNDTMLYYFSDNYITSGSLIDSPYTNLSSPSTLPTHPVTMDSVQDIYDEVLDKAGCSPMDDLDTRVVSEVRAGTGSYGRTNESLASTSYNAFADTDNDGMPDEWETNHGLDPNSNDSSDTDLSQCGYTNIEVYINGLITNPYQTNTTSTNGDESSSNGEDGGGGGGSSSITKITSNDSTSTTSFYNINTQSNIYSLEVELIEDKTFSLEITPTENPYSSEPDQKVYGFYDIETNLSSSDIENAKIRFKVEKSWINLNNIDESSINLYKYADEKWNKLDSEKISEDSDNVYYSTETSGFSIFAIAGKEKIKEPTAPTGKPFSPKLLLPLLLLLLGDIIMIIWFSKRLINEVKNKPSDYELQRTF